MELVTVLIIVLTTLFIIAFKYMTRHFDYWKKRGIEFNKPIPFFGNFFNSYFLRTTIGTYIENVYNETDQPYKGVFVGDEPFLVVKDLDIIKSILVRDFDHFTDRTVRTSKSVDPIAFHFLFASKNPVWKEVRSKVSPFFTSGRLKLMQKLIIEHGKDMVQYLDKQILTQEDFDVRDLTAKFSVDVITSTAFGIRANSFSSNNPELRNVSKKMFNTNDFWQSVSSIYSFIAPNVAAFLRMSLFDANATSFLKGVFWDAMKKREETKVVRNDLLDLIIDIKKKEKKTDSLLDDDVVFAQAVQFFAAGFETSSSTITYCLYELAKNPEIQTRLREEVTEMKEKYGDFTYECLQEMTYLNMVTKEILRMYPILPFLDRKCNKEYTIPGTDIKLDKDSNIFISITGIQNDPQYFPEPKKFDPERFSPENKDSFPSIAYLAFGEGPRFCIGMRLGYSSVMSCVASILLNYEVLPCAKTSKTIEFHYLTFLLQPKENIILKFRKIKA